MNSENRMEMKRTCVIQTRPAVSRSEKYLMPSLGCQASSCKKYDDITTNYINQQPFSLSGEEHDMCYYSYGPDDLKKFLTLNASNKYTFLPMTVYPTDSANGKRHDMIIIFYNINKRFYHFDGRNRDDYMKYSKVANKNIIDILMFYIQSLVQPYI